MLSGLTEIAFSVNLMEQSSSISESVLCEIHTLPVFELPSLTVFWCFVVALGNGIIPPAKQCTYSCVMHGLTASYGLSTTIGRPVGVLKLAEHMLK